MLFMGEEWGAAEPFPFFCDFNEDLNEKVRKGRREELSRLPGFDAEDLPDPTSRETFNSAKLDWSKLSSSACAAMLDFYRTLLNLRRDRIVPLLRGVGGNVGRYAQQGEALFVEWHLADKRLQLQANLSGKPARLSQPIAGEVIYGLGRIDGQAADPWSLVWSLVDG
jgi:1,4-alpha-glucan branching enzyme